MVVSFPNAMHTVNVHGPCRCATYMYTHKTHAGKEAIILYMYNCTCIVHIDMYMYMHIHKHTVHVHILCYNIVCMQHRQPEDVETDVALQIDVRVVHLYVHAYTHTHTR